MLANGSLKPIWSTQFRLLAADYNDQTEELKLRSEVYVLSGSLIPPYLAISYTWFDAPSKDDARPRAIPAKRLPTLTDQVTVDDRPVPVTRNLANAIHHVVSKEWSLRPKTMGVKRSLRLWCDYLCIDQTNAIEKGQQVQHMTNIFGNATKVIAWLGLPYNEEEAQFAIALMSRVGVTYRDCVAEGVTWVRRIYRDHPEIWPEHSEWSAKVWRDLEALFNLPDWSRAFIYQEVTTPHATTFRYGTHSFDVAEFTAVVSMIFDLANFPQFTKIVTIDRLSVGNMYSLMTTRKKDTNLLSSEDPYELIDLLSLLRTADCTDARDKVYAISGLARDIVITPRYDENDPGGINVFLEAATKIASATHVQRVLNHVFIPYETEQHNLLQTATASWVPDWRHRTHCQRFTSAKDFYSAGGPSWSCRYSITGFMLNIAGFDIARISSLSEPYVTRDSTYQVIRQWRTLLPQQSAYERTGEDMEAVYLTTIVADFIATRSVNSRGAKMNFDFLDRATDSMDPDKTNHRAAMQTAIDICLGRRLCVTESGLIGLVPAAVEVGDAVCVLLGCGRCHVLRLGEAREAGAYLGEAYVHGIMDGEATKDAFALGRKPFMFRLS